VERVAFANALRGVAALSVVIAHYVGTFWVDRPAISLLTAAPELQNPPYANPPYFILLHTTLGPVSWGAFGVALFFVISGFVIPFSLAACSRGAFVIGRLFRIVPTYMAGFAVTVLAITINAHTFGIPFPYTPGDTLIHFVPGLRDLMWRGTIDGIVWTLEVELKFYLLAALVAPLLNRGSLLVFAAPMTIAIAMLLRPSEPGPLLALWMSGPFLIFMFAGVALNFYYRGLQSLWTTALICGTLFLTFAHVSEFVAHAAHTWPSFLAALALFVIAMLMPTLAPDRGPLRFLASVSYPLYVVHGMAGYVVMGALLRHGMSPWLAILTAFGIALLASYTLHRIIEQPSQKIGKAVSAACASPRSPSPSFCPPALPAAPAAAHQDLRFRCWR
jgi:peptidoglycan/LPS O-acetylase OafA/YrhL